MGSLRVKWGLPIANTGDHVYFDIIFKSLSHFPNWYDLPDLGFPDEATLKFFPLPDITERTIILLISFLTTDNTLASNVYYTSILVLNFFTCMIALECLGIKTVVAAILAIGYATIPYFFARIGTHDFLSAFYACPLLATVPLLLPYFGQRQLGRRSKWAQSGILMAGVGLGALSGFYYFAFGAILLVFIGFFSILRPRGFRSLAYALPILTLMICLLFLVGLGSELKYLHDHDLLLPVRDAIVQPYASLRLSDIFLRFLSDLGIGTSAYNHDLIVRDKNNVGDSYPGVLLCVGICVALASHFWRNLNLKGFSVYRWREPVLVGAVTLILFIFLFATAYGFGYVFNAIVNPTLRAQERIAPFLAFYSCVVLGVLHQRTTRSMRRPIYIASLTALLAVTLLSAKPAINAFPKMQKSFANSKDSQRIEHARKVNVEMDRNKTTRVFQLPVIPFNDDLPRQLKLYPYWMLDNYIVGPSNGVRKYSHGLYETHPTFQLLKKISETPVENQINTLVCLGFDAVSIDRRAYVADLDPSQAFLSVLGRKHIVYDDEISLIISLPNIQDSWETCADTGRVISEEWIAFASATNSKAFLGTGWEWGGDGRAILNTSTTRREKVGSLKLPLPLNLKGLSIKLDFEGDFDHSLGDGTVVKIFLGKDEIGRFAKHGDSGASSSSINLSSRQIWGRDWLNLRVILSTASLDYEVRFRLIRVKIAPG